MSLVSLKKHSRRVLSLRRDNAADVSTKVAVEVSGLEPLTSCLQSRRSTN